jgi:hypothetical protein
MMSFSPLLLSPSEQGRHVRRRLISGEEYVFFGGERGRGGSRRVLLGFSPYVYLSFECLLLSPDLLIPHF